ncbi:hypothetical protein J6590_091649 [Homalodisca vitripennis]|nr:hypothetical protein J6590_091649 [Homalodisca vitripennis]
MSGANLKSIPACYVDTRVKTGRCDVRPYPLIITALDYILCPGPTQPYVIEKERAEVTRCGKSKDKEWWV